MGFLDEVAAETPSKERACRVRSLLLEMDPKDRSDVEGVLALPPEAAPHLAIQRALKRRGLSVSTSVISRHRRGECSCVVQ